MLGEQLSLSFAPPAPPPVQPLEPAAQPESDGGGKGVIRLRNYQIDALDALRNLIAGGSSRNILCAPTGAGKTVMASELIRLALAKGSRVLFLADRIVLVDQTSAKLWEFGIPHGRIQGDNRYGEAEPILVGSAQTMERWDIAAWEGMNFDLVIIDEAHTLRKDVLDKISRIGVPTVGLTATPFTKGLGKHYGGIANAITTYELIRQKWLVNMKAFIGRSVVDMSKAGKPRGINGEWTDEQAAKGAADIVCDIPIEWAERCQEHFGGLVKSLFFVPTVAYGTELETQVQKMGADVRQVSYRKSGRENKDSIRALREGECDGLISVEALVKGLDITDIQYVAMARRYRSSLTSVVQLLGRGMRSHPGKDYFVCCDHAQNLAHFGDEVDFFWARGCKELDDGKKAKYNQVPVGNPDRICQKCKFVMPKEVKNCPMCGHRNKGKSRSDVTAVQGKMVEWNPVTQKAARKLWADLSQIAIEKHPDNPERARKLALANYREIKNKWPPKELGNNLEPNGSKCDPAVRKQVNSNFEKWIRKQKRKRNRERKQNELHGGRTAEPAF